MGTDDGTYWFKNAKPIHEVTIPTFEMSKTEVTVEQYAECVTKGRCTDPGTGGYCNWGQAGRQRHPVSYTEYRNTQFQGLAANIQKDALARILLDAPKLIDVQMHAQVHDSVIVSVQEGRGDLVREVARRMLSAAAKWLPDVLVKVELCGPGRSWHEAKLAGEDVLSTDELNRHALDVPIT